MALASILLSVLSFGCAAVGVVTTPVPRLGTAFSFAAPLLALLGVTLAGIAMSTRKRQGERTDVARAGVILNVIAFVPGMLVALTCGVCNAVVSSGNVHMQRQVQWSNGSAQAPLPDAGQQPPPQAGPGTPGSAPGALPPPPLPPGPAAPATGH